MDIFIVLAIILGLVGIVGSVAPALPGPPLSWVALLLLRFSDKVDDPVGTRLLIISFVVVAVVWVVDYFLPGMMTKSLGGHKAASTGATIGLLFGMFLTPMGMIGGSLLGAFLGEFLVENKGVWASFKASIGAFMGFLVTTLLKLITSGSLLYIILSRIF